MICSTIRPWVLVELSTGSSRRKRFRSEKRRMVTSVSMGSERTRLTVRRSWLPVSTREVISEAQLAPS